MVLHQIRSPPKAKAKHTAPFTRCLVKSAAIDPRPRRINTQAATIPSTGVVERWYHKANAVHAVSGRTIRSDTHVQIIAEATHNFIYSAPASVPRYIPLRAGRPSCS